MTLVELLVLAAVVFGAGWLLWDREQRQTDRGSGRVGALGDDSYASSLSGAPRSTYPSSVRVIPPVGRKPR